MLNVLVWSFGEDGRDNADRMMSSHGEGRG